MHLSLILNINIFKVYLIKYNKNNYNFIIINFIYKIFKLFKFKIFFYSILTKKINIIILLNIIIIFIKNINKTI